MAVAARPSALPQALYRAAEVREIDRRAIYRDLVALAIEDDGAEFEMLGLLPIGTRRTPEQALDA